MLDKKSFSCVYCLNDIEKYCKMFFNSVLMLRKHSNIPIKVIFIGSPSVKFVEFCSFYGVEIIEKKLIQDGSYFPINKKYIGELPGESLLFIDCDTFINGNVEKIFEFYSDYDFVACCNYWVYGFNYDNSYLKNSIKPFNSGVMLFNNGFQNRIYEKFDENYHKIKTKNNPLGKWLFESGNGWTIEEFTVSKCVADLEIKTNYFERNHCYNIRCPNDFRRISESIIFHSYTKQWPEAYVRCNSPKKRYSLPFRKV